MKRLLMLCTATALLITNSAAAGPWDQGTLNARERAWFYNRAGATTAERDQMLATCGTFGLAAARNSVPAGNRPNASLVGDILLSAVEASVGNDIIDACMVWNGYRRFDVAGENQQRLSARIAAMDVNTQAALAGASQPPIGVLGREWANAYWLRWDGEAARATEPPAAGAASVFWRQNVGIIRSARDPANVTLGPNEAIIVASIRRVGETRTEHSLVFGRVDPATGAAAAAPHGTRLLQPFFSFRAPQGRAAAPTAAGVEGLAQRHAVFVVPAGTYSLDHQESASATTEFCLRSIAFSAHAGQVLHIGDFTISSEAEASTPTSMASPSRLRVDPGDLARARAAIQLPSNLEARLEQAVWYNGLVTECNPGPRLALQRVYGIEIPGAGPIQSLQTVR